MAKLRFTKAEFDFEIECPKCKTDLRYDRWYEWKYCPYCGETWDNVEKIWDTLQNMFPNEESIDLYYMGG